MSGKLIMKRKRASQEEQLQQQQQQQDEEPAPEKRHRPLTPPAEDPSEDRPSPPDAATNRILLEALQKIMELQSELDAFEQDLDEREDYAAAAARAEQEDADSDPDTDPEDAEVAAQFAPVEAANPAQRSQAEALGFAMCARETLLFLQSEGVPTESPLYQTLLGKLVGQSDGLLNA